jgi:hypothetical protein
MRGRIDDTHVMACRGETFEGGREAVNCLGVAASTTRRDERLRCTTRQVGSVSQRERLLSPAHGTTPAASRMA